MDDLSEIDKRNLELLKQLEYSKEESDRGLVLFSAAQVDLYLTRILKAFLIDDKSVDEMFDGPFAPYSTLSGKTTAAFSLGLISREEAKRINAVRKVRNVFAHEIDASFNHDQVKKLCAKSPIYDGRLADRDAFLHMAMNIIPTLMYRDIRVLAEWKRKELVEHENKC
jgi:hypothetical protein